MNKILVVYRSKYGATEKYVKWLQEEMNCDTLDYQEASPEALTEYDNIIFASGVYAQKITIASFVKKLYANIKDKNVTILSVGITPYSENYVNTLKKINLSGEVKNIPLFYAPGNWDVASMKFLDKLIAKVVSSSVKKKNIENNVTEPNVGNSDCLDLTSKEHLSPIINYLSNITND